MLEGKNTSISWKEKVDGPHLYGPHFVGVGEGCVWGAANSSTQVVVHHLYISISLVNPCDSQFSHTSIDLNLEEKIITLVSLNSHIETKEHGIILM